MVAHLANPGSAGAVLEDADADLDDAGPRFGSKYESLESSEGK